jgi:hypothetical protein
MEAAWIDPYLRPQVGFFTHIEVERKLKKEIMSSWTCA